MDTSLRSRNFDLAKRTATTLIKTVGADLAANRTFYFFDDEDMGTGSPSSTAELQFNVDLHYFTNVLVHPTHVGGCHTDTARRMTDTARSRRSLPKFPPSPAPLTVRSTKIQNHCVVHPDP